MRHANVRVLLANLIAAMLKSGKHPFKFRPYQKETLEKMVAWLRRPKASRRAYIAQATGLGKTVEFEAMIRAAAGKLRVLVIVPGKPLVLQTVRRVARTANGRLGHVSTTPKILDREGEIISLKGYHDHDIVVTTDDSLKRRAEHFAEIFKPDVVIWDECHWGYTEKAQAALDAFPEAVVVGFSATPDYLGTVAKANYAPVTLDNGQVLYGDPDRFARTHFGECLDERGVRWGIENGFLVPFAWGRVEFQVSLKDVPIRKTSEGIDDYDQGALHKVLAKNWKSMMKVVCKLYESGQHDLKSRSAVAICPGVKEAQDLAVRMTRLGVSSVCVHGGTTDEERDVIFGAYEQGKIKLITSVFVLREGWDMPRAEVCLMLRPTKSRVLYIQFIGRVFRLLEGHPDKVALVLDPLFQDTDFSPLSAPVLFGLPGQSIREGDILIRPRGKRRRIVSPYSVDRLAPILVVERPEIEYWADESSSFYADGEWWSSAFGLEKALNISRKTIHSRLGSCRSRMGRPRLGPVCPFYAVQDVKRACKDLLGEIQADSTGILMLEGEEWAHLEALGKILGLSRPSIGERLHECRSQKAKNAVGRLSTFYAVTDARKACKHLLEDLPQAGPDGTFVADGQIWGAIDVIAERLSVSHYALASRIKHRNKSRPAFSRNGGRINAYSLEDAKKVCSDLLAELPQAGSDGTFMVGKERWGTVPAIARILDRAPPTVRNKAKGLPVMKGKMAGMVCDFYPLSLVEEACKTCRY